MTTVRTIVTNAMRLSGLVGVDETPDAAEAAKYLAALNDMAMGWSGDNIHTGWPEVTLNDTFPLEDKHREGVTALLVQKILTSRQTPLTPYQTAEAIVGLNRLEADFKAIETLHMDAALQGMPSQRWIV